MQTQEASAESTSSGRYLRAVPDGLTRRYGSFPLVALVVVVTLALPVLVVSLVAGEVPIIGIVVSGLLLFVVVVLLMTPTMGRS